MEFSNNIAGDMLDWFSDWTGVPYPLAKMGKKITPKLLEWDKVQANRDEYELIREANLKSNWPELSESVANQNSGHGEGHTLSYT